VRAERGFSLLELIVAVGVVSLIALGGAALTLSSRSLAVSSSALRFDALLDAARTSARAFEHGVTIAFVPDAYGDGFRAQLYANRPGTAPLLPSTIPAFEARVALRETETLGVPAFALTVHADGNVAGIRGDVFSPAAAETACPPSGAYHVVFSYGAATAERYVSCRIATAVTGPPGLVPIPPAVPLPPPTAPPCNGAACAALPTPRPVAGATPIAVAVYFAGPTAVQQNAQPGSYPQPCEAYPLYAHTGSNSGDASSGGWFEDDWYLETLTTTAGAFVALHGPNAGGWWTFDGDSFGKPNGTYLDPAQFGAVFHASGTYGAGTDIGTSAVAPAALIAAAASSTIVESDYLHESCVAAWSDTPGGGG
jgi:prepilin-type N-terminal cleavage/methylation domain-containing protein